MEDSEKQDKRTRDKEWREKHPEYMKAYMLEWRAKNKERIAEQAKARSATDQAKAQKKISSAKYFQETIKTDPEKYAALKQRRAEYDAANHEAHMDRCKRHRDAHKAELAATAKAKYQAMSIEERKALHAKRSAYHKAYREKKKDTLADNNREWREKNADQIKAKWPARYAKDKLGYIRRARKRQGFLTGTYADADIAAMYETQKGICPGCQSDLKGKFEIDHKMQLAKDPAGDVLENLQLLCKSCNRRKSSKTPEEWARFLERRARAHAA